MNIHGMNHFTILADDLAATREFYVGVLGFREGYRPPLPFPGAWYYLGDTALLHVIGGRSREELRAGVLDHMAFSATGLAATLDRLDRHGVRYDLVKQIGTGFWQVFFHDPNNAKVELDFAADEVLPSR